MSDKPKPMPKLIVKRKSKSLDLPRVGLIMMKCEKKKNGSANKRSVGVQTDRDMEKSWVRDKVLKSLQEKNNESDQCEYDIYLTKKLWDAIFYLSIIAVVVMNTCIWLGIHENSRRRS